MTDAIESASLVAYAAVLRGEVEWLLLTHPENSVPKDKLVLQAQGSHLSELKRSIRDLNQVFVAFYRQDVNGKPRYLLINYVPPISSAIQQARTLVQSRRLGTVFTARQTTLTINSLDDLTENAIFQALTNTDTTPPFLTAPTMSQSSAWSADRHPTYDYPPSPSSSHTDNSMKQSSSPIAKTASKISKLLGRKKKHSSHDSSSGRDFEPPPPPPKDAGVYSYSNQHTRFMSTQALPSPTGFYFPRQRVNSLSEFGIAPHDNPKTTGEPFRAHSSRPYVPSQTLPSKWARDSSKVVIGDPAVLLTRRREAQRTKAQEMERAKSEEAERQALRAQRKEEARRLEEEEEDRKRQAIEEEMRRVKMVKKQMAEMERIAEEKRRLALEERRRIERERRLEEHKRLEMWRVEQTLLAEEAARRHSDLKRREKQAKRDRIRMFENRIRGNSQVEDLVTGWLTVQTADALTWKRRFYKFSDDSITLYRDPKDTLRSEEIYLRGDIKALREWDEGEGFDELKAIPHSFGVEFNQGRESWSIYADTEDEKFKLMGLLYHAGGLED